jgi:GNAT superfamily N-acetyltransferase
MNELKPINRSVDIFPISDPVVQYMIYSDDGHKPAGYCIVTARMYEHQITNKPVREAALWHIFVDPSFRRQRFGSNLLEALKATYDTIFSQAQTDEGKKLMMDSGFVREEGDLQKVFRWTKKYEPGIKL